MRSARRSQGSTAASRCRRTHRRAARSARGRDARRRSQGVRAGGRDRDGGLRDAGSGRSGARGPRMRHRAHAVRGRGATGELERHPADRRLCGDLGHLGQRRGTLAECCGRGASPGRSAARLEGAARTREPARRDGIRLPELRGRSQRAARARWTGCTPHRRPRARLSPAICNGVDKVRGTPIYRVDAVVRRSRPLQETRAGRAGSGIE